MVEYNEQDPSGSVFDAEATETPEVDGVPTADATREAGASGASDAPVEEAPADAAPVTDEASAGETPADGSPADEGPDDQGPTSSDASTDDAEADATEADAAGSGDAEAAHAEAEDTEADDTEADDADAVDPEADDRPSDKPARPEGFPEVITTTTLFFVAPDLPPLPALPDRSRGQHGDRDDAHDGHDDHDRGGSRRRGRGSRRQRGGSPNADQRTEDRGHSRDGDGRRDSDDGGSRASGRSGSSSGGSTGGGSRQQRAPEPITEPQKIKGSTRLEAKRQRRREGRDFGRRRTVVTESEFLARRESVDRTMLVRAKDGKVQIGVLEDQVLVEHYVARSSESSLIGNVYLGRVQNVLPSMEAAFIDIGRGRNAVLYSGEVDWAAAELGQGQARKIENALKPGDKVLVQVTKDPVGHKGARLTSQVSLPGRYLVYVPGNAMNGISRKLPDTERSRLKKILKEVLPEGVGVIVRTAAEGATHEQLERDVNRLTAQWEDIRSRVEKGPAPALLHSEPDLLIKIIRDVFNEDFQKIVIQGREELETITAYLNQVAPDLVERVEAFEGDDVFVAHRATEFIEKALDRKVWLPSGGSLVIDRTEAMTVVDVNTGKFVGSGGNLEETVTKNNLEAAEEVVRQLRLRDIGGIIVIDFIDMVLESNRDLVLRRLVECLSRDRTKHQVAEVTSLGLVQMTRKKIGLGLLETFSEPCATCAGRGVIVHHDPVAKHRSDDAPSGRGRRGRGGGGGDRSNSSSSNGNSGGNGTHAITDEARGALSRIAASTLKTEAADAPAGDSAPANGAHAAKIDATSQTDQSAASPPAEASGSSISIGSGSQSDGETSSGESRSRRSRRGRRRGRGGGSNGDAGNGGANGAGSNDGVSNDGLKSSGSEGGTAAQDGAPEGGDAKSAESSGNAPQAGETSIDVLGITLSVARETPAQPESRADTAALDALLAGLGATGDAAEDSSVETVEPVDGEAADAEAVDAATTETEAAETEAADVVASVSATEATPEVAAPEVTTAPNAPAETVARGASGRPKRRRVVVNLDGTS